MSKSGFLRIPQFLLLWEVCAELGQPTKIIQNYSLCIQKTISQKLNEQSFFFSSYFNFIIIKNKPLPHNSTVFCCSSSFQKNSIDIE